MNSKPLELFARRYDEPTLDPAATRQFWLPYCGGILVPALLIGRLKWIKRKHDIQENTSSQPIEIHACIITGSRDNSLPSTRWYTMAPCKSRIRGFAKRVHISRWATSLEQTMPLVRKLSLRSPPGSFFTWIKLRKAKEDEMKNQKYVILRKKNLIRRLILASNNYSICKKV